MLNAFCSFIYFTARSTMSAVLSAFIEINSLGSVYIYIKSNPSPFQIWTDHSLSSVRSCSREQLLYSKWTSSTVIRSTLESSAHWSQTSIRFKHPVERIKHGCISTSVLLLLKTWEQSRMTVSSVMTWNGIKTCRNSRHTKGAWQKLHYIHEM